MINASKAEEVLKNMTLIQSLKINASRTNIYIALAATIITGSIYSVSYSIQSGLAMLTAVGLLAITSVKFKKLFKTIEAENEKNEQTKAKV